MSAALLIFAIAFPGFVRLGHWQLPSFGILVTMGLIAALFTSLRTAPLTGLDPDRLWNAGVVAVLSAFAASRALLIAMNPHTFLHQPLLVLVQPSLTVAALALAALFTGSWLRRRHLPLRQVADAWAVPGVLLAATLQLGRFAEGTGLGMPTSLPWGVVPRGGHTIRLHPVQLYATAAYVALAAVLFWRQRQRQRSSRFPGEIAALALGAGGAFTFLLGFVRIPYDLSGNDLLDPGQWTSIFAAVVGAVLWLLQPAAPAGTDRLQEAH